MTQTCDDPTAVGTYRGRPHPARRTPGACDVTAAAKRELAWQHYTGHADHCTRCPGRHDPTLPAAGCPTGVRLWQSWAAAWRAWAIDLSDRGVRV